jgi:hypothetical protein
MYYVWFVKWAYPILPDVLDLARSVEQKLRDFNTPYLTDLIFTDIDESRVSRNEEQNSVVIGFVRNPPCGEQKLRDFGTPLLNKENEHT